MMNGENRWFPVCEAVMKILVVINRFGRLSGMRGVATGQYTDLAGASDRFEN